MSGLFANCSSPKKINLSSFNSEKVTDMNDMFSGCCKLEEIDLSSFKNDNVTDMSTCLVNAFH